ncbi:MAG: CehA/McbA family metallohydrolase [Anaerolineae bacterium]
MDVTRIQVEYAYSHRIGAEPEFTGGNTIDLGLFDARGSAFPAAGFRGWSGSERDTIWISETEATPGYLAGPLIPGQWHVLLGLYKIAPEGCAYRVAITITTAPARAQGGNNAALLSPVGRLPATPPAAPFWPWLRGELHCHTWHSDGASSPGELVQLAYDRGLDFLAVTDHNTTSSQSELATLSEPGLVLLRGMEVTTFKGHFNVWGIGDWIDFRVESPEQMEHAIRAASEHGGLTSCNHPKPNGPPWEYPEVTGCDCVEVWNGPWTHLNELSLNFWLEQLGRGMRKPAIGGSDYHRASEPAQGMRRAPGTPTTWVHVTGTPSEQAVLAAIRRGHVTLSAGPEGPLLELVAGDDSEAQGGDAMPCPVGGNLAVQVRCRGGSGNELRLLDQNGTLHTQSLVAQDQALDLTLPLHSSLYLRAELRDTNGKVTALTNPIYFR